MICFCLIPFGQSLQEILVLFYGTIILDNKHFNTLYCWVRLILFHFGNAVRNREETPH